MNNDNGNDDVNRACNEEITIIMTRLIARLMTRLMLMLMLIASTNISDITNAYTNCTSIDITNNHIHDNTKIIARVMIVLITILMNEYDRYYL